MKKISHILCYFFIICLLFISCGCSYKPPKNLAVCKTCEASPTSTIQYIDSCRFRSICACRYCNAVLSVSYGVKHSFIDGVCTKCGQTKEN